MAIKVLVNALGQHIVAEVKQVENKETQEVVGYWLENPRLVNYVPRSEEEGGGVNVGFGPLCPLTDEQAYTVRADHIISIVEPRDDVAQSYSEVVGTTTTEEESEEACEDCESGDDALAAAEADVEEAEEAEATVA